MKSTPTIQFEGISNSGIVDNETGIIKQLISVKRQSGEPEIYNYAAVMSDTGKYFLTKCTINNGGAGLTEDVARQAAIGEAVERYCSSVYFENDLILGSRNDINSIRSLSPNEINYFHQNQKGKVGYAWFTDDLKICWAKCYSISNKETVLIPASLVFLPYDRLYPQKGEMTIAPSISTGTSCATSYNSALISGIYEIIERDAFSITWLNKLSVPMLDIDSSPTLSKIFHEKFERHNLEYFFFNLATDIPVPSIFCILVDNNYNPPLICVGGASNLDAEKAALKSLIEAAQTHEWSKLLVMDGISEVPDGQYDWVDSFEKHVRLYSCKDMRGAVEFLTSTKKQIKFSEFPTKNQKNPLEHILKIFKVKDYEVFVANLTTPDIMDIGYVVLKTIMPTMVPLYGDHRNPLLGSKRIFDIPAKLGYVSKPYKKLNAIPHPYP